MSVQDLIKKSILESGAFDGASLTNIALGLITAILMGAVIYLIYSKFYVGVIYSRSFAITLVGMTILTAMVTLAISTNIVISLGMVGALSIVRFRTAIKDPLDIGFLFWSIAAGITAGAGLYFVAIFGTVIIAVIYIIFSLLKKEKKNYLLIVRYNDSAEKNVNAVLGGMKYRLKNKTVNGELTELTIEVKVKHNDTSSVTRFKEIDGVSTVTLLEYSGEYIN